MGKGPVGDLAGNTIAVGHDNFGVVVGAHHGGPQVNLLNLSPLSAALDKVPYLDGSFKEHDEATLEVMDDLLEAEVDVHPQSAAHAGQLGEQETQRRQGQQEA